MPGNGTAGFGGDGSPASQALLNSPGGIACDSKGNVYIADGVNNCLRKIDVDGNIHTLAGNGSSGYSGDGGNASSALLNNGPGVGADSLGNIYIADTYNHRIRRVDALGVISTVAGNGTAGDSGDGGPATSASLNSPGGVACDNSGNIYIADSMNNCIRRVDPSGKINTVAGDGTAGYAGDGGPATLARMNTGSGVAVDSSGNIYIADTYNQCIRKVDTSGNISTIAGNGVAINGIVQEALSTLENRIESEQPE